MLIRFAVKFVQFLFVIITQAEDEQRPLPEDLNLIDGNIKTLEDQANELKYSVKYGFDNLRSLQIELGIRIK